MLRRKAGVYFYNPPYYNQEENKKTYKIGHSGDIINRFRPLSTFLRKEDNPINFLDYIIYSPTNTLSGTRLLECITHNYFSVYRECKQREFFTFYKDIDMEGLLEFFRLKKCGWSLQVKIS